MAVLKLSQISAAGANFTSGDFLVAVQGGTTDVLFSFAQLFGGANLVYASDALAQIRSTTAQAFRVYNTTDSNTAPANYERGMFDWTTTSNILTIGTQKGGSGTARAVWLTAVGAETVVEQTGDTFGATRLRLQNRSGSNGAVFENATLDLVDFAFNGSTHTGNSVRMEGRNTNLVDASNTIEFQIGTPGTPGAFINVGDHSVSVANTVFQSEFRVHSYISAQASYHRLVMRSAKASLNALSGATVTATNLIPDGAVVVGLTTKVNTTITGATGYTVGDGTTANRWGAVVGTAVGTKTQNTDWTVNTIQLFTAAQNVVITASTSNFTGGQLDVHVHYLIAECA
jgi:hypothetical protein